MACHLRDGNQHNWRRTNDPGADRFHSEFIKGRERRKKDGFFRLKRFERRGRGVELEGRIKRHGGETGERRSHSVGQRPPRQQHHCAYPVSCSLSCFFLFTQACQKSVSVPEKRRVKSQHLCSTQSRENDRIRQIVLPGCRTLRGRSRSSRGDSRHSYFLTRQPFTLFFVLLTSFRSRKCFVYSHPVLGRDYFLKKATDACLYQGRSLPATKENELDLTGFNRMSFFFPLSRIQHRHRHFYVGFLA